jgi:putative acetyltransferase
VERIIAVEENYMITFETQRLILRPFLETDLDELYENCRNPKIGPMAGWGPHKDKDETARILKIFMDEEEVWAIVSKETNKLIGSLGLHTDRLRSSEDIKMLGYVLAEDYWGKGYMVEAAKLAIKYAFENLKLTLLSVNHFTFNHQSKRVIEKCGFHYEGTLRYAAKTYDGTVYDLACYSITKDEWQQQSDQ